MKRLLSLIIIVFIMSSVLGVTFLLIKTASTSNTSNVKLVEAFFGKTTDVAVLPSINLANAESAFTTSTSPVLPVTLPTWPVLQKRPLATVANINLPSIISDWSTYDESAYDITMKYPANWYVHDDVPLGGSFEIDSMNQSLDEILSPGEAKIVLYRSQESVSAAATEDAIGALASYRTSVVVAGVSAARLDAKFVDGNAEEDVATVYLPHDGFLYRIVLEYGGESHFANIFAQFLSSVQFGSAAEVGVN